MVVLILFCKFISFMCFVRLLGCGVVSAIIDSLTQSGLEFDADRDMLARKHH